MTTTALTALLVGGFVALAWPLTSLIGLVCTLLLLMALAPMGRHAARATRPDVLTEVRRPQLTVVPEPQPWSVLADDPAPWEEGMKR